MGFLDELKRLARPYEDEEVEQVLKAHGKWMAEDAFGW